MPFKPWQWTCESTGLLGSFWSGLQSSVREGTDKVSANGTLLNWIAHFTELLLLLQIFHYFNSGITDSITFRQVSTSIWFHNSQEFCNALVPCISLSLRALGASCVQFLVGCAHLRKQPLFQGACETAFEKCRDPETSDISRGQLADVLRLSMLLPSDDGVSLRCSSATNA